MKRTNLSPAEQAVSSAGGAAPAPDIAPAQGVSARGGRRSRFRRISKLTLKLLLGLIVFLSLVYLTVRHVVWPHLDRWQPQVEQFLTAQIGLPVKVQNLSGEFEGFSPAIRLDSLRIGPAGDRPVLLAEMAQAVLSWRTIFNGRPNFEFLRVKELSAVVERVSDRRLAAAGMVFDLPAGEQPVRLPGVREPWLLPDWLMRQQSMSFEKVHLQYRDRETGESTSLVNLQFRTNGTSTERLIELTVPDGQALTGAGELKARLSRTGLPSPTRLRRWEGEAFAEIAALNLPLITSLLRLPEPLVTGTADARAWFTVVDSKPNDARLLIDGKHWQVNPAQPDEQFESLQAEVDVGWRNNGNVDLTVLDARAVDQTGAQIALNDKVQLLTLRPDLTPARARFSLTSFDAARLMAMVRTLPFPTATRRALEKIGMDGQVNQIDVDFDARSGTPRYQIEASFTGLGLAFGPEKSLNEPILEWSPRPPWFEQLTGTLKLTERGGNLQLFSDEAALGLPGIYAEPRVDVRNLGADIEWLIRPVASAADGLSLIEQAQRTRMQSLPREQINQPADLSGLSINIKKLQFENDDAAASISGTWSGAGKSRRGTIDLKARLRRAQLTRTYRYLPTDMPADVRRWIQNAVQAGTSDDVRFVLRGDLFDFPFRKPRPGELSIEAEIVDGSLKFLPDFPALTNWQGKLQIKAAALKARADTAYLRKAKVAGLNIGIAEFKRAILKVEGSVTSRAQEAVKFINDTPLTELIDDFLASTRASGSVQTRLSMNIPLKTPEKSVVLGVAKLAKVKGRLNSALPRMSKVNGEIKFGTDGFSADKLRMNMYGGPATLKAATPEQGRLVLDVNGVATSQGLRAEVDTPITRRLDGRTRYDARLQISDPGIKISLSSNLQGMALQLPEPLRKAADQTLPLTLQLRPVRLAGRKPARWGDRLAVKLGKDLQAIFERDPIGKDDLAVKRGVITVDSIPVMPASGLSLAVNTRHINMDRWLEALELVDSGESAAADERSGSAPDSGYFKGFELEPTRASIVAPAMIYNSKKFTDVVLGASRTDRNWAANISTKQVNGYVNWIGEGNRPGRQPQLIGKFQRLEIPDSRTTEFEGLLDAQTTSLPALDIVAENFILTGRSLGRLQLKAANRASSGGWEISRLSLYHPTARLAGSGLWTRRESGAQQTLLNFDLDLKDAGGLLAVLGQPDTMRGGSGKLSGKISWRGAPADIDIPTLAGDLTLALGPGQFLRTEPGFAKLIGVLSLQSIPRRLSLDFSDIFSAGFAFDTVVGAATMKSGTLKTDNLLMNGVQAQVLLKGEANLLTETQDMTVQVLPTINAGLASIAYAAVANPAVGIGTLVAQLLLQDPLRRLFRYEFEIDGPWADPQVVQTRPRDPSPPIDPVYGPN